MESFLAWMLESSLLVLMISGIRKVFAGRISYAGIYALWLVVLFRFMVPVNFLSTPVSVANIVSGAFSAWNAPKTSEYGAGDGEEIRQQQDGSAVSASYSAGTASGKQKKAVSVDSRAKRIHKGMPAQTAKQAVRPWEIDSAGWKRILQGGWMISSALLFLWILLSNVCLMKKMKRDRVLFGHRGKIRIYTVPGIQTPCLYGFFRPAIYLPSSLMQGKRRKTVSGEDLNQMITHEFVHYLHGDHIWSMLRMLLVSVYWFHPFVWLASSLSKKDAELFCDETVIRMLGEEKRFCYGEMLVRLAGDTGWGDFRFSVMPMSRKGREMEKRIFAISEKKRYSKWMVIPLAAVLLSVASITCSTGIRPLAREAKRTENAAAKQTASGAAVSVPASRASYNVSGTNPEMGENVGADGLKTQPIQKDAVYDGMDGSAEEYQEETVSTGTYEQAFENYMEYFTDAVNTGNIDKMDQVLEPDSDVYRQQCNLVKNYYKRGIREKVKSSSISSVHRTDAGSVEIDSREKIKVFYGDGTSKVVRQKYRYTCKRISRTWIITGMEDIL